MNRNELLEYMRNSNPDQDFLDELQQQLTDELAKPVSEQDYDLIDELTEAISVLNGTEEQIRTTAEAGIQKVTDKISHRAKHNKVRRIAWKTAAVCASLIVLLNIWTYSVYGINAFSAAYQMLNGGINVDLTVQDDSDPTAANRFEEDMRSVCAEYGLDALIPKYIPDGFTKKEVFSSYHQTTSFQELSFHFEKGKSKIIFQVQSYNEGSDIQPVLIPSDSQQFTEQTIQGNLIRVFKEDQEYRAVFLIGRTQYLLYANKLDYDECQRILQSMFD